MKIFVKMPFQKYPLHFAFQKCIGLYQVTFPKKSEKPRNSEVN